MHRGYDPHEGLANWSPDEEDARNKSGIEVSDIIDGLGPVARLGDRVSIKYQLYSKKGRVQVEKGPLELTLGRDQYGQGFDEGILDMKVEGTRELKIPPHLCPHNMPTNWRDTFGIGSKEKKKFYVTVLAILETQPEPEGSQGLEHASKLKKHFQKYLPIVRKQCPNIDSGI